MITGDGSIGLAPGLTPLETAIDRDIAVTVVVANNAQWGMIKNQQKEMWGRELGTSLRVTGDSIKGNFSINNPNFNYSNKYI